MSIDKAKGIIAKPMPREWYDVHSLKSIEDEETRKLYSSIIACKKPYFMQYIYPSLAKQYLQYTKNANKNCMREFGIQIPELMRIPEEERTERQSEFLFFYNERIPVGDHACVMNKICHRFEEEFDGFIRARTKEIEFDYTIMKSGAEYLTNQFKAVSSLYSEYSQRVKDIALATKLDKTDDDELTLALDRLKEAFCNKLSLICPDPNVLCEILLDVCYTKGSTKRFVWDMCSDQIIHNLFINAGRCIHFPTRDEEGDISYRGDNFSIRELRVEDTEV